MGNKDHCVFCNIDTERSRILKRFRHCYVMFSNPRLMPGHILVIPNRHVEFPYELTEEERKEIFDVILKYQEKVMGFASGCDVKQHCRPFLPEGERKVDHVHYHILPREFKDELFMKALIHEDELFKKLPKEEINSWIEKMK